MESPHELITVSEAAKITGLDKMTIYRLARTGRLRSFKVLGTALRFDRRDVVALLHERPAMVIVDRDNQIAGVEHPALVE
jgi:excisionase family DNA binding protein